MWPGHSCWDWGLDVAGRRPGHSWIWIFLKCKSWAIVGSGSFSNVKVGQGHSIALQKIFILVQN